MRVPDRLHGRAFAAYNGIRNGAELGAFAAGGVLVAAIGPTGTLAYAGGLSALCGLIGLLALLRMNRGWVAKGPVGVARPRAPRRPPTRRGWRERARRAQAGSRSGARAELPPGPLRAPLPALARGQAAALDPARRHDRAWACWRRFGVCAAYQLSNEDSAWLWAASGLLVVQWLGDSLDGTLARVREIQRPKYGFYLDHMVDAIATAAIGIGLGLSPFMLLSIGTLIVVAYLILSINVYLESMSFGRFRLGYGFLGPTEIRCGADLSSTRPSRSTLGLDFNILDFDMTVFDAIGLGIAGVMLVLLTGRAFRLRELAKQEPPAPRR